MLARGEIEKIICDKCGYANEAQRIFCHECGARLDRSEYLKEVEKRRSREADEAPRHLKNLARKPLWLVVKPWLIIFFGSMLAALLLQLLSPPYIPEEDFGENVQMARMDMGGAFDTAVFTPGLSQLTVPEDVLNAELDTRFRSWVKTESGDDFWAKALAGAHVNVNSERLMLTIERKIFGLPLYFTGGLRFKQEGRRIKTQVVHAQLGRQTLPAFFFAAPGPLFEDVLDVAKISESQRKKVSNIELRNGAIRITVDGSR